jgi:hypothetical protein
MGIFHNQEPARSNDSVRRVLVHGVKAIEGAQP